MRSRARSLRVGRRGDPPPAERGSLSLEFALAVPLVFLVVLVVMHAAVFARDALVAQNAAARGARVAAATGDSGAVRAAVADSAQGRPVEVRVEPGSPRSGQVVTVTVSLRSTAGPSGSTVTARAAAEVEPGVGA